MSEFYRNYLAVAVFIGAALLMVGAMLGVGRLLRPAIRQDLHHHRDHHVHPAGADQGDCAIEIKEADPGILGGDARVKLFDHKRVF